MTVSVESTERRFDDRKKEGNSQHRNRMRREHLQPKEQMHVQEGLHLVRNTEGYRRFCLEGEQFWGDFVRQRSSVIVAWLVAVLVGDAERFGIGE